MARPDHSHESSRRNLGFKLSTTDLLPVFDPSVSLSVHDSANITGQKNRNFVHIIFPAKFLIDHRETAKDKRGSMTGSSAHCEKEEET